MTEKEKLMYNILVEISKSNAPIVFKGALITKLALCEQGFEDIERKTNDIDANWVDKVTSVSNMADVINESLALLNRDLLAKPFRDYADKQTAGLNIYSKSTGEKLISMDLDVRPIDKSRTYFYEGNYIKGILPNEIIADKICAVSKDLVYKYRAKDAVDLYALAQCTSICVKDIYDICKNKGNSIMSFDGFLNHKPEFEHAYNKLKGINGKPEFSKLYEYLYIFVKPFIDNSLNSIQVWNPENRVWMDSEFKRDISTNVNTPQVSSDVFLNNTIEKFTADATTYVNKIAKENHLVPPSLDNISEPLNKNKGTDPR